MPLTQHRPIWWHRRPHRRVWKRRMNVWKCLIIGVCGSYLHSLGAVRVFICWIRLEARTDVINVLKSGACVELIWHSSWSVVNSVGASKRPLHFLLKAFHIQWRTHQFFIFIVIPCLHHDFLVYLLSVIDGRWHAHGSWEHAVVRVSKLVVPYLFRNLLLSVKGSQSHRLLEVHSLGVDITLVNYALSVHWQLLKHFRCFFRVLQQLCDKLWVSASLRG